jgi:tRNA threonylcarbamoyladenosine biosynthesis protein TsaB
MLLAVDTATHLAGLALYDEESRQIMAEEVWHSPNNHTVELMPRLVRMMNQQGITPANLTGLVVSQGPGSFTGLRIGLAVVKGLALAHALPIVGVPTLDAVARPHMMQRLPIWAILKAGRGRICAGHYVPRRGRWRLQGPYQRTTYEELCSRVEKASFFCGEIDVHAADLIREQLGAEASIATPAASLRRAAFLAEIGWERLARGESDDAAALEPIYLHHPQIDGQNTP